MDFQDIGCFENAIFNLLGNISHVMKNIKILFTGFCKVNAYYMFTCLLQIAFTHAVIFFSNNMFSCQKQDEKTNTNNIGKLCQSFHATNPNPMHRVC